MTHRPGVRKYLSRARRAISTVAGGPGGPAGGHAGRRRRGGRSIGRHRGLASGRGGRRCRCRAPVTGEGQEDLIQVGRRTPISSTATAASARRAITAASWVGPPAAATLARPAGVEPGPAQVTSARIRPAGVQAGRPGQDDLDDVAPHARLELAEGAGGDGPAVVDDDDVIGQLVGLVQVVGGEQHVGPRADQGPDRLPDLAPPGRIEAGGRLVQEEQARGADQAGAEVEAAALTARVGAGPPVGHLGQAQLVDDQGGRRRAPAGRCPKSRAVISRFSRPVMVGSTAANCPARPMTRRTSMGWRATSWPRTRRVPPVGRTRVATVRTNVVLPAPLGPRMASTSPGGAVRSRPSRAVTGPKRTVRPGSLQQGRDRVAERRSGTGWRHVRVG